VLDLYAAAEDADAGQTMELDELLGYLKSIDAFELGPIEAVLVQTEAIGDPALPSNEQAAILEWVNVAYSHWEEQFPIEEPLASEFRKLLPLAAALAITEPDFLTPGKHSFHLLMDTMQASVIGWQSLLGRAGQNLERELTNAVKKASQWFEEEAVDLTEIYQHVATVTAKDRGRAERMSQLKSVYRFAGRRGRTWSLENCAMQGAGGRNDQRCTDQLSGSGSHRAFTQGALV